MKKRLAALCVLAVVATTLFAQTDLQPLVNVKLNKSESITLKNLKARVAVYQKQTGITSFSVSQKKEILDALIDEKLILQAAAKAGISLTDSQVNELYLYSLSQQYGETVTEAKFAATVREQYNISLEEFFQQQLAMSVSDYKVFLKNQYIAQQYVLMMRQNELQAVAATDAEIRRFYELNKAGFYQVEILQRFQVAAPKGENAAEARALLWEQYEKIKNGTMSVDQLKVLIAANPDKIPGGDIYAKKEEQAALQMGLTYDELIALFAKENGYVSEFMETKDAYFFYVIIEKFPEKMLTLSDLVQPGTNITVYDYIRSNLTAQKQSEYFSTAVTEITESLRNSSNYQMLKTGDALDKLLENW